MTNSNSTGAHQERVNQEMFRAIELLGRKLEQTQSERDDLAQRLANIESSATLDEKTGRYYLPAVVDAPLPPQMIRQAAVARWSIAASCFSLMIAAASLLFAMSALDRGFGKPQVAFLAEEIQPVQFVRLAPGESEWQALEEYPETATTVAAEVETLETPEIAAADLDQTIVAESLTVPPAEVEEEITAQAIQEEITAKVTIAEANPVIAAEPTEPETAVAVIVPPLQTARSIGKATAVGIADSIDPDTKLSDNLVELERRAFQGSAEAQHDLATLYAAGKVVDENYSRSAYWFYRAADGGIANAHYNLGVLYHQGMGVKTDLGEAIAWYENAAELGHPEAMYNLGIAYVEGVGVAQNIRRGVSFFRRAAASGIHQAAFNLGVLYESSFMGKADIEEALEWYQMAARSGHDQAAEAVARLSNEAVTLANIAPAAGAYEGEGDASAAGDVASNPLNYRQDLILNLQEELVNRGLLTGTPDGRFDQRTRLAISTYQKQENLPLDGLPSEDLLRHMRN